MNHQHFQDVHRRTSNISNSNSNSSNSNSNNSNNNNINLKTEHNTEEAMNINNTIRNNGNNKNPNNHHHPNHQKNKNKIIDPNSIDVVQIEQILTNELNNCSMTDRNNIQEEIHGVNCCSSVSSSLLLSPTSTTTTINIGSETNENKNKNETITITPPELFEGERSLQLLTNELNNDEHIPRSKKYAYLLSQELQDKEEDDIFSLMYVNTNEFRFMYLRCEFFDIRKTALRIVQVLDFLFEYYGKYALYRKIQLTDFTEYELTILKNKGYCQLLPSRDRGGRRIMVQFLLNDFDNVPIPVLQKIFIYLCFVCASSDVEDQRKGIVLLCWAEHLTNQHRIKPRNGQKNIALLFAPIRFVSIHLCAKNTIFTNIIKAVIIARLNSDYRRRLICNLGESVEVRYSLQGYGIPVDSVPVTWSGAIKTVNVKRFINFQTYIEEKDASSIVTTNNTITDCPYLNDILFKKGHTAEHQPGNMQFRSIINSVYTQHYLQQQQQKQQKQQQQEQLLLVGSSPSPSPSPPSASAVVSAVVSVSIKVLVPDIIQKIKQDERFRVLVWDNNQHWWNILSDPLDYKKHIYASTHFFLKNYVIASSSSSSLTTPKAKAKSKARSKSRVKVTASASVQATVLPTSAAATAAAAAAAGGSNQKRIRQQQVIESSTSIFNKSPDGKKRMTSFDFIRNHITNTGGGNSDRDSHSDECFGLPFQAHNI